MKTIPGRNTLQSQLDGFTLIELLVVVVIITILAGIALPVMKSVRKKANMATEINAGRQLTAAYLGYAADNDGQLMPGYVAGATVTYPNGDTGGGPEAERYPWRLAPYVQWNDGLYLMNDAKKAVAGLDPSSSMYRYMVSLSPALGLNTYCVGGYQSAGGMMAQSDVATRLAQVERLGNLVAFVSARTKTAAGTTQSGDIAGSFYVRPPIFSTMRWRTGAFDANKASLDYGNVDFRYSNKAVVTFLDGSVRIMTIADLRDMRLWARLADSASYAVKP